MSYLLHGSTAHTGMGWVDAIPRTNSQLYIGGLYALYQTDLIAAAGITHVVSVIDYDALLSEKFSHLKHLHIRAEDHPNENLLRWFEEGVGFMDAALRVVEDGGMDMDMDMDTSTSVSTMPLSENNNNGVEEKNAVFVHCAMGKSRSATIVVAYLMWKYGLGAEAALQQVCEGRPVCDPNPGFKEQLEVWGRMCGVESEGEKRRIYKEWESTRFTGEVWDWEKRRREGAKL